MNFLRVAALDIMLLNLKLEQKVNIPNTHACLADYSETLASVAKQLGVDLDAAGYTFTVDPGNDGLNRIYEPNIRQSKGKAVLAWGKTEVDLPAKGTLIQDEGFWVAYDVLIDGQEVEISFRCRMADKEPDGTVVRKAFKSGKFGDVLSTGTSFLKLIDLTPGTIYTVIDVSSGESFGKTQYLLHLEDGSKVKANTAITRRLSLPYDLDAQHPATLVTSESTETTGQGHPIVPVQFTLSCDKDLPVYQF